MKQIVVHKGRTVVVPVSLGMDVSADTFSSDIREAPNSEAALIASWVVSFDTDGTDGEVILTLDNSVSALITKSVGYMDIKRITGGEPVAIFDEPLEVFFQEIITQ